MYREGTRSRMTNDIALAARLPKGDVQANIGRLRDHNRRKKTEAFRRTLADDIGVPRRSLPSDLASLLAIADWYKDKQAAFGADVEADELGDVGGFVQSSTRHDYYFAKENGVCPRCSSPKITVAEFGVSAKCDHCRVEFCG